MAKNDFSKFTANLEREIRKVTSREFLQRLARMASDIIYKRVKSGKGVNSLSQKDPTKVSLKALSASYVEQRKKRKLGKFGSPGKSNLTLTGELLESIVFEVTRNGFQLKFPDTQHRQARIAISLLSEYVQEERPFFALTKDERRILEVEVQNELRKLARRV